MSGFDILKGIGGNPTQGLIKGQLPTKPPLVGDGPPKTAGIGGEAGDGSSFAEKLDNALGKVRELQLDTKSKYEALGRGEDVPLHDVMMAMGKSEVAFNLMLEVRNKLLEAWQQLSRSVN